MKLVYIYALCEPGTRTIRYIGKSIHPVKRRVEHMKAPEKMGTHAGNWLSKLKAAGEIPDLLYLSVVTEDLADAEEKSLIKAAHKRGADLTNATEGGDGVCNPSLATREKESRAKKLAWQNPEVVSKHSRIMKRYWKSPAFRAKRNKSLLASRTPEYGQKMSKIMTEIMKRPLIRAKLSLASKNAWKDPAYRAKNLASRRLTKRVGASSKYFGVSRQSCNRKWDAKIRVDGKSVYLGHFLSELDAARAYNVAARKYFGASATVNTL